MIKSKIVGFLQNRFLKSGVIGAVTALSFAPFNAFPIFLATFAWLFVRISQIEKTTLLSEAFCFFFFLHFASLYWVAYPLTLDLSKYWILIPFAITVIPAYLSIFLLIPTWGLGKVIRKEANAPIAFAAFFSLTMMFYGNFLPGFPWVLPGYIWCCHEVFLQTLNMYGIYGLSFVTLLISGFFGLAFLNYQTNDLKKCRNSAIISVSLFLFIVFFGCLRLAKNPTQFTDKKIRMVQCNISQKNKNNSYFAFLNLKEHLARSTHNSRLDFVIWPEVAVPYLYRENFTQLHNYLKSPLADGEYLLTGAVRKDLSTAKIYNSVVVIDHDGKNVANYDKSRLLPFGEYVPFRQYIPFQSIASDIGDFDVGKKTNVIGINGTKIIFAICYEIVFPIDLISHKRADLIINITNDGWFGFTSEPFQHLQISRARAIETGLPMVRATNYGISAVFDPYGREIARVPIDQAGIIEINIPQKAH
jgi:apolipoprotein N-acyltransferase